MSNNNYQNINKSNQSNQSNNNSISVSGGKAIASGGYGCVLRPPLKCQGDVKPQEGMISKLMKKHRAEDEMKEVDDAKNVLKNIPNYEKYFAVTNYRMCVPAQLKKEDKKNFDDECQSPLDADSKYVNKHLNDYRAIISPDLGIDVSKAFKKIFYDNRLENMNVLELLYTFNETAKDFLKNGIAKMSSVGYYHSDVKPQNILTNYSYSDYENRLKKGTTPFTQMKLIDFGLALPYKSTHRDVNRNILFNFPVSAFMFSSNMRKRLDTIITNAIKGDSSNNSETGSNNSGHVIRSIKKDMSKIVKAQFDGYDFNHIDYMVDMGSQIYNKTHADYEQQLKEFFIDYCSNVLKTFVKKTIKGGKDTYVFDVKKYWEKVYRYNLDVWGFLTSFLVIASEAAENYSRITDEYMIIIEKFLYNPKYATEKIPVDEVNESLTEMNKKIKEAVDYIRMKKQKKAQKLLQQQEQKDVKVISVNKPKSFTKKSHNVVIVKKKTQSNKNKSRQSKIITKLMTRAKVISIKHKKCPKGYKRHKTHKNLCIKKV